MNKGSYEAPLGRDAALFELMPTLETIQQTTNIDDLRVMALGMYALLEHSQERISQLVTERNELQDDLSVATRDATAQHLAKIRLSNERRNLEELATTDNLTSLNNLHALELWKSKYKKIMAVSNGEHTFAAITLDVANFKLINDILGYDEGNKTLISLGSTLLRFTRSSVHASSRETTVTENQVMLNDSSEAPDDVVCFRIGGDEFLILVDIADKLAEDKTQIVEKIIQRVKKQFKLATASTNIKLNVNNRIERLAGRTIDEHEPIALHTHYTFNEPNESFDSFYGRAIELIRVSKEISRGEKAKSTQSPTQRSFELRA